MDLRPHHLLCIQKFVGKGYNYDFTEHMKYIVSVLKNNPKTSINLIDSCDELCLKCPNNQKGVCTSIEKVSFLDRGVIDICKFSFGDTISFDKALIKARDMILNTDKFDFLCSSCQWYSVCKNIHIQTFYG